jgi:acetyltransferase-like isoleucine patch superfamily enzyme
MKSLRALGVDLMERLCESLAARLVTRKRVARAIGQALLHQYVVFGDEARVTIAPSACVNNALLNVASGRITIDGDVVFGHNVSLLTGSHATESLGRARLTAIPSEGRDIVIQAGAWIASNATIIGPVIIGQHAVVAAGAVVTCDVAARTMVAGVPARPVRLVDETVNSA